MMGTWTAPPPRPKEPPMDDRIAQMMRVMEVLHELGLSVADSLRVLKAFYDEAPSR